MNGLLHAGLRLLGLDALLGGAAGGDTAWDYSFTDIDGQPLPLARFRGQAVLIVNTASMCGFTVQYKGLEEVFERYRERGLMVLGVPSNDFGGQEPGDAEEIRAFCTGHYKVGFPLTEKTRVVGEEAHPFYRWAVRQRGVIAKPRWNFHKYLIAPNGRLAAWFATTTAPTSSRVIKAIEGVLPK